MKVTFDGFLETSRKGCSVCGKRRTDKKYLVHKSFMLPSGRRMTFFRGVEYEVSDLDASFLLRITYEQGGETKHSFHQV